MQHLPFVNLYTHAKADDKQFKIEEQLAEVNTEIEGLKKENGDWASIDKGQEKTQVGQPKTKATEE